MNLFCGARKEQAFVSVSGEARSSIGDLKVATNDREPEAGGEEDSDSHSGIVLITVISG